jgi:hypothetical protein
MNSASFLMMGFNITLALSRWNDLDLRQARQTPLRYDNSNHREDISRESAIPFTAGHLSRRKLVLAPSERRRCFPSPEGRFDGKHAAGQDRTLSAAISIAP